MITACPGMPRVWQPQVYEVRDDMNSSSPDELIALEIQQGNSRLFPVIVDRYGTLMLNYLYRLSADRDDAEDMVQELFVRVFRNMHTYKPELPFKPWLYRIATNVCYDYLKKKKRLVSLDKPLHENSAAMVDMIADRSPGPDEALLQRETVEDLQRAVASLPEKHREVFVLFHYDNLPYHEIAAMMDIPEGTVKSRLHYAAKYVYLGMQEAPAPPNAGKGGGKSAQ